MANKGTDEFGQKGQGSNPGTNPPQRPEDLDRDRNEPYDRDLDDQAGSKERKPGMPGGAQGSGSQGTGGQGSSGQGSNNPGGTNR